MIEKTTSFFKGAFLFWHLYYSLLVQLLFMTDEQDLNNRKQKVIGNYMEYVTKLRSLTFGDMSNFEQFKEMSALYSKAASEGFAFSEYLKTYFSIKINSI